MDLSAPRVVLYSRPGCHLCAEARELVAAECARAGVTWTEVDVTGDPALEREHGDYVPVLLVDGVRRGIFRVDPDRLRRALAATPPV